MSFSVSSHLDSRIKIYQIHANYVLALDQDVLILSCYLVAGVDICASFDGHGMGELDRLDTVQIQFDP